MNIPLIIGAVFGIFLAGYLVGMFCGERIGAESQIAWGTLAAYSRVNVNDVCRVMVDEIESVRYPTEVSSRPGGNGYV